MTQALHASLPHTCLLSYKDWFFAGAAATWHLNPAPLLDFFTAKTPAALDPPKLNAEVLGL